MAFPRCDIHLLHLRKTLFTTIFPQKLFSISLAVAFRLVNRPRQQPFAWRSSSFITTPVYPSCFLFITNVNLNAFTLEVLHLTGNTHSFLVGTHILRWLPTLILSLLLEILGILVNRMDPQLLLLVDAVHLCSKAPISSNTIRVKSFP